MGRCTNSAEPAIETRGLTRRYSGRLACDSLTLAVPAGGIFGLLGCNGAGKSTFVKMLVGLVRPTAGSGRVLGRPLGDLAARRHFGFLPETFRFPDWATGIEVLRFHAALADIPPLRRRARIAAALDAVGLGADGRRLVRTYSKGMQQRLGLASALLADPPLLFLDEPTSALDPLGRRQIRELLVRLRGAGKTVFLNSHLLSEVEMVCDRLAVMRSGRLAAAGTLDELVAASLEAEVELRRDDRSALDALERCGRLVGVEPLAGGLVRVRLGLTRRDQIPELAAAAVAAGGRLYGLRARVRSLEDVFVELVTDGAPPQVAGEAGTSDSDAPAASAAAPEAGARAAGTPAASATAPEAGARAAARPEAASRTGSG